jgi:parallel beta-helix repeat protein
MIPAVLSLLSLASLLVSGAPCTRVSRAGTELRGDTKICPGRYRIADPGQKGVLVVAASGLHIDLDGVIIESGDSVPARYSGYGLTMRNVDSVAITGGTIRGYRVGVLIEGGSGHSVTGMTLSGSRMQALRSTPSVYAEADWLDIFHPDTFETYGAGIYLKNSEGITVQGVIARDAQNGIMLSSVRRSQLLDNDVSDNSGWGISLWRSSRNALLRNRATHNVRCEGDSYSRGCDSAALLIRQRSDSNVIADNDLRWSGDGFFLSGHQPGLEPSVGNLVIRNDASHAYHNAFEATWSWGTTFLENRADSSAYGFWLGYSTGAIVRGNTAIGSREVAIAIEHGSDNEIAGNILIGGKDGIRLFTSSPSGPPSRGYRVDDNTVSRFGRGLVLQGTTQARVRGNVFDGDNESLVADVAARDAVVQGNIFLRPGRFYVIAPELNAGGNFWGSASEEATGEKVSGNVVLAPWSSASSAGY